VVQSRASIFETFPVLNRVSYPRIVQAALLWKVFLADLSSDDCSCVLSSMHEYPPRILSSIFPAWFDHRANMLDVNKFLWFRSWLEVFKGVWSAQV